MIVVASVQDQLRQTHVDAVGDDAHNGTVCGIRQTFVHQIVQEHIEDN